MKNNKLTREEQEVLFHIYGHEFMVEVHPISFGYLLSEYKRKFDKTDLERILENLVLQGYLNTINEYSSPNAKMSQNLEKIRVIKKDEYDKIVNTLAEKGLLEITINYGIPNVRKYQEIKRFFWKRRALNWLNGKMHRILQFLWKNIVYIIVALIIAIITYYLTGNIS